MVYKKYEKRRGKTFGPYYYESYRDGDKVKKIYIGGEKEYRIWLNKKNKTSNIKKIKDYVEQLTTYTRQNKKYIYILFSIIFILILFLFSYGFVSNNKFTGFIINENASDINNLLSNSQIETVEQQYDSLNTDLEIKNPVKSGEEILSKNKNKRMDFDLNNGKKLRLYFDLLNYSEFIENVDKEISKEKKVINKTIEEHEKEPVSNITSVINETIVTNITEVNITNISVPGWEENRTEEINKIPELENKTIEEIENKSIEPEENKTSEIPVKEPVNETKQEETKEQTETQEEVKDSSTTTTETETTSGTEVPGSGEQASSETSSSSETSQEPITETSETSEPKSETNPEPEAVSPGITGNIFRNFLRYTAKVIAGEEEIIDNNMTVESIDVNKVKEKINDLESGKINDISDNSSINIENFDIVVNENVLEESNKDKPEYKWGYEFKLNDLKFMAKIEVTSEESLYIIDKDNLRIGRYVLSFEDLVKAGYKISFETPLLEIDPGNLTKIVEIDNINKINQNESIINESLNENINSSNNLNNNIIPENNSNDNLGVSTGGFFKLPRITGKAIDENNENKKELEDLKYNHSIVVYIERDFTNSEYKIGDIITIDPSLKLIYIRDAIHLDSNRSFISNIFDSVKSFDNLWSEEIKPYEYVRVSFERSLDRSKDITIYARKVRSVSNETENSTFAEIGVYRQDSDEEITRFININNENWYKVYLTNLTENESYDTFDLRILNNSIIFDYIVDPAGDTPRTNFTDPTPANGTRTINSSFNINVSIAEASSNAQDNIKTMNYSWNNSVYTIYDPTLILMYNFGNRSGIGENSTYVNDVSNYSNNGIVYNNTIICGQSGSETTTGSCPMWNSSGKYEGAWVFDGSDDYINVSVTQTKIFYSMWIRNKTTTSWKFVAYNGTNYYLNGKSSTATGIGGEFPLNISGSMVRIGVNYSNGRYFNGSIDEVRIWNRSLSTNEIDLLFRTNLQKYNQTNWNFNLNQSIPSPGIYGYYLEDWDFDDDRNSTETRYIITALYPTVNLVSPVNEDKFTSSRQYFIANYTDDDVLKNATLYIWNVSDGAVVNSTEYKNITGATNSTNISVVLPFQKNFKWNYYVCDNSSYCSWNETNRTFIYGVFPTFSNYWDDNGTIIGSGTAHFNVTVKDTNGTVWLNINNANYSATNLTANMYNVSVSITSGDYNYKWLSWGNGTYKNYNFSSTKDYTVNFSCPGGMNGSGTAGNPCNITNCTALQNMSERLNVYYILGKNINCSATVDWDSKKGFNPIGDDINKFTGSLDGQGHTIKDLFINRSTISYIGLLGYVWSSNITNLGLINVNITGKTYVGALAGYSTNGIISECFSNGTITSYEPSANSYLGGLVGYSQSDIINDSYSQCLVNASRGNYVGGLVGYSSSTPISNCYSTGYVDGSDDYIGGLVGYQGGYMINNSFTTSTISCNKICGGLAGDNSTSDLFYNDYWYDTTGGTLKCSNSTESSSGCTAITSGTNYFYYLINPPISSWDFPPWSNAYDETNYPPLAWYIANIEGGICPGGMSGGGTSGNPCIVTNCSALQKLNESVSVQYALGNNINCSDTKNWNSGAGFIPIGYQGSSLTFVGILDGRNHTVSNLFIKTSNDNSGLFGNIADGAIIKNIGLIDCNITGADSVGGLAGRISSGGSAVKIYDSYTTGNITGADNVGGLIGYIDGNPLINDTYSNVSVNGSSQVGGLIGNIYDGDIINNSYATGNVTGGSYVGGFIGFLIMGDIGNSFSTGNVSGSFTVGGFIGKSTGGSLSNCFYNNKTFPYNCTADGYSTGCTAIQNNISYFYDVAGPPMANFSYPPWSNAYDKNFYPPLAWQLSGGGGCPGGMDGSGISSNPCNITNCTELQNMSANLTAYYVLGNNIDCSATTGWNSGAGFNPIGNSSNSPFNGSLDGQNHTISYLFINRSTTNYVGLFGQMTGNISNVGLIRCNVIGGNSVGCLIGRNLGYSVQLKNYIKESYSTGDISGSSGIGGLVGNITYVYLNNSYSNVSVNGSITVGGLVGISYSGDIYNSFSTGNVTGSSYVGGLVGSMVDSSISNSFSTGNVSCSATCGGLVGFLGTVSIVNSYWNNKSNPSQCTSGADPAGCTAIQNNISYFYDVAGRPMANWSYPPWDNFCNRSGYPSLKWQGLTNIGQCYSGTTTADTTNPAVNLFSPINATNSSSLRNYFIANYTDNVNVTNATLYIWNVSNNAIINNTEFKILGGTVNSTNISVVLPYDGNFKWNYYACDDSSNCAWNATNWTIRADATKPTMIIKYPTNTTYRINVSELNYSYADLSISRCWYSNTSGIWNSTSVSAGTNFTNVISIDGFNNWTLYCNDSSGNENWTRVFFTMDITGPNVILNSPVNTTNSSSLRNYFSANYTDVLLLKNATLYVWNISDGAIINSTEYMNISGTWNSTNISVVLPYDGYFKWNYYACDNQSNCAWNATNWTIRADASKPQIRITYPVNGTIYSINVTNLNYSYIDANPGYCWWSNSSGTWNSTSVNAGTNFTTGLSGTDGLNAWTLYCNDSAGNMNSTNVTFYSNAISNCSVLGRANTSYILLNNIVNNQLSGNCINITGQNISLDCMGYSIRSTKNYTGVYTNQYNTTVKNCNITMGSGGNASAIGIEYNGANYGLIFNNTCNNNTDGIYLNTNTVNNTIRNNTASYNYIAGIRCRGVNSTIDRNNLTINLGTGGYGSLHVDGGRNNITYNYASGNTVRGFLLNGAGSSNSYIANNVFVSNSGRGIEVSNSENNTIILNTGTSTSGSAYYISGGTKNNFFDNEANCGAADCINLQSQNITWDCNGNTIASTNNYTGIYSSQLNTTIKNCNISMGTGSNSNSIGIELTSNANNSFIINNTIINTYFGMNISSEYNLIENNFINNSGNSGNSIYLNDADWNLLNNNVCHGGIGAAVNFYLSEHSVVYNLTAFTYGTNTTAYATYINTCNNNTFYNSTFIGAGVSSGLYIDKSNYGYYQNCNMTNLVSGAVGYGLYLAGGNHTIIKDSLISGIKNDTYSTNTVNNTLINCTFDKSKESVLTGAELIRKWYYKAYVNDSSGYSIYNSNVSSYNVSDSGEFSLLTGSTGYTDITTITDYINSGGTRNYYSNYTLSATKTGFTTVTHGLNITNSQNKLNDVFTFAEKGVGGCQNLPVAGATYILVDNIINNTITNDCVIFLDENITFDCSGYYIKSNQNYSGVVSMYDNSTIKNCNITMGTGINTNSIGIEVYPSAELPQFLNIINNTIYGSGLNSGINLVGLIYSLISNNSVNLTGTTLGHGSYSIFINGNYNNIINNIANVSADGNSIDIAGISNTLINNKAKSVSWLGIVVGGEGHVLINNTGISYDNAGIAVMGCTNCSFINNTGKSTISAGIGLENAINNTFTNNIATSVSGMSIIIWASSNSNIFINQNTTGYSSGSYGLYIEDSNSTLFKDCINITGVNYDIQVTADSKNTTIINCSYINTKELVDNGGELIRKWYYRVYVNYSNGTDVPDANVSAFNVSGKLGFSILTNGTGWTNITTITDYINFGGTRSYYSNYSINATKSQYSDNHSYNVSVKLNNLQDVFTFTLSENTAPNNPVVGINSTDGTNTTRQNISCFAIISDNQSNQLNVSVKWYKNSSINLSIDYNNSYTSGSLFISVLNHTSTTKGENWSCGMRLYDGLAYSSWVNSSNLSILNTLPVVNLDGPSNDANWINRTPTFNWTGVDDDGDSMTYEINITKIKSQGSLCTDDDKYVTNSTIGSRTNYTVSKFLICLSDNQDKYKWSARASDGGGFGLWNSTPYNISVKSLINLTLPVDIVNFGSMNISDNENTSDDSPAPLVIKNWGNVETNITANFSDIWQYTANNTKYYQYKVRNLTSGCFILSNSVTSWTNATTATISLINRLNFTSGYQTKCDNASVDISLEIPPGEGAGNKNSTITFIGSLGELY